MSRKLGKQNCDSDCGIGEKKVVKLGTVDAKQKKNQICLEELLVAVFNG